MLQVDHSTELFAVSSRPVFSYFNLFLPIAMKKFHLYCESPLFDFYTCGVKPFYMR